MSGDTHREAKIGENNVGEVMGEKRRRGRCPGVAMVGVAARDAKTPMCGKQCLFGETFQTLLKQVFVSDGFFYLIIFF